MYKNTIVITFFLVLSGVLGFVAQIVFANSFGASAEMDVYFKILSVPAILTGISTIIFSSVLIPAFAKLKTNELELETFIESLFSLIFTFGVLFALLGFVVSVYFTDYFIPESTPYFRKIGIQVSLMVWIGSGFIVISGYLSAILNYRRKFFSVAWTNLLPASLMIFVVLLFNEELGIRSIALGYSIALVIQFIVFFKASKLNMYSFKIESVQIPFKNLLLQQSFLVTLSLLPFTILAPIAYFWASSLEIGSISYLGYSQNFAGFLSVVVSMGISIVSLPELADRFADENSDSSLFQFEKSLRLVMLLVIFASGALITLRIPILQLFYQRGAFDLEAVNNLSDVLPWYLLAAIFIAGLNFLRTFFYSRGEFKKIAWLGIIIPIIFFLLAGVLKEKFSFVGIGMAYSLTFALLFFTTIFLAQRKDLQFLTNNFLFFILKNTLAVISTSLIVNFSLPIFANITYQLVSLTISLILFFFIYILISKFIFKLNEIQEIITILMSKLKSSVKS